MMQYYPRAPMIRRLVAVLVDTLIAALPFAAVIMMIFYPIINMLTQANASWAGYYSKEGLIALYAALPFSFAWFCCYALLRDSFGKGQSWGKKLCGLMVMDLTRHRPCDKKGSLARNYLGFSLTVFMLVLPILAPLLALVEPFSIILNRQGLRTGDRWAGTQVIDYKLAPLKKGPFK